MSHRAVYDTMVLFQWAALPESRQHGTMKAVLDGTIELCLSAESIAEIGDLLSRPAIQARSRNLTPERTEQILRWLAEHGTNFHDVPATFTWEDHPDDDHCSTWRSTPAPAFL